MNSSEKEKTKLNKDREATGLGGEELPDFELLIEGITKKKFQIMQTMQH